MGQLYSVGELDEGQRKAKQSQRRTSVHASNSSKTLPVERAEKENDTSTRRRFTRLGTIRRKLAKSLKGGKNSDYRKHIRELLQNWPLKEIQALVKQYDGLDALKKLSTLSNAAKPPTTPLATDLQNLLKNKACSDLNIEYNGKIYQMHKSIVCCRCKFFAKYLQTYTYKDRNDVIKFEIPGMVLSSEVFSALLNYIYTGNTKDSQLMKVLSELGDKFGMLNPLFRDMKVLLGTEKHSDVLLVYPKHSSNVETYSENVDGGIDLTLEIPCHSALLCARSAYFCNLLSHKQKQRLNHKEPLRIAISENIIPRCFIRVILSCIYTGSFDLSTVIKWKVVDDGSGEADRLLTISELAMEIFEVGQFLEISSLIKRCESILVENFSHSSLLGVLEWSCQPHGSAYVYRQAMQYLREEFLILCKIPAFICNISKRFLLAAIQNDYLQANEEFVLLSVIKWGEWQIAKSCEKSGCSSPGNSLPRRSPKRRDISNDQLREVISPLIPHIRLKHILPFNSPVLYMAYQRGLLQRPFPFDVVGTEKLPPNYLFWLASYDHPDYITPRLFNQYVIEAKLVMHERLLTENETSQSPEPCLTLPDMLPRDHSYRRKRFVPKEPTAEVGSQSSYGGELDEELTRDMVLMEKEFKMSAEALNVMKLMPDCKGLSEEIQLRVVRSFGLPDEIAAEVFRQAPDLVESGGSSHSSKQNTLSRVGRILQEEGDNLSYSSIERSPHRVKLSAPDQTPRGNSFVHASNGSPSSRNTTLSYAQSPLDLPFSDEASGSLPRDLPNVLLDT